MVDRPVQSQPYSLETVYRHIEQSWSPAQPWPQYAQSLRLALCPTTSAPIPDFPFAFLPGLCCQASGGDSMRAVAVAAAWVLLYTAAHVLDDLEDGETAGATAPVINAATGLIFTAIRALVVSSSSIAAGHAQEALLQDFADTALRMCCGQHADLTAAASSLEECWKVAEAKSGACFGLACRAGARLSAAPAEVVECYSQFGVHLGMLVQVCNDLHGICAPPGVRSDLAKGRRTLPVMYALSVLPVEEANALRDELAAAPYDQMAEARARQMIEQSGSSLYLTVEARRHGVQALACLDAARPLAAPRRQLAALLNTLLPQRNPP